MLVAIVGWANMMMVMMDLGVAKGMAMTVMMAVMTVMLGRSWSGGGERNDGRRKGNGEIGHVECPLTQADRCVSPALDNNGTTQSRL